MKEILNQITEALQKVRCYTLKKIIDDLANELISADEALNLLKDFNEKFALLDVEDNKDKDPIQYNEFIQIGEADVSIYSIKSISKNKYYNFKDNKLMHGIIINKSNSDFIPNGNLIIYFDTEEIRDKEYLYLKDRLCLRSNIRFN